MHLLWYVGRIPGISFCNLPFHYIALERTYSLDWCNGRQIRVESLSAVNIIFGDWQRKDCFLLLNHIILIAKQYIYYCRSNNLKPLFHVLLQRIKFGV